MVALLEATLQGGGLFLIAQRVSLTGIFLRQIFFLGHLQPPMRLVIPLLLSGTSLQ